MAKSIRKTKLKEPVKVRTKKLANGVESYYLDIYYDGQRRYEFLKLYWLPETNAKIKEQNRATLAAVETIKSQRIIELTKNKAGLKSSSALSRMLLTDWIEKYLADQTDRGVRGTKLIRSTRRLIETFNGKKRVRLSDIDKNYCLSFTNWLRNEYKTGQGNSLTPKSMSDYIGYFSAMLNAAIRADIIRENPFMSLSAVDRVKVPQSKREFLTIEEIKTLIDVDCPREDVKKAYLFSCYCGLRLSDIYALRWKDLTKDGEQWRASVIMQKTTTPIFLPLSNNAMKWLPERGNASDEGLIFGTLPAEPNINKNLKKWIDAAGIVKHITFHTARHTFATMMLTLGADLYTTSKLLGHTNVQTTQIYAKIVDKKKVAAINLIDKAFE